VLGIRDIFDADPDSHLRFLDLDLDPTPFFSDLKGAKKNFSYIFFLIIYPQAHYLES
jgi:hypothetical protein